ncbi:MAG TPA: hypothetical protein VF789_32445 [Thermoanaerobaculia bacterium]
MSLTLYFDENVSRAILAGVRLRGVDCVRDLELIAKVADPEDLAGRVQFLPL